MDLSRFVHDNEWKSELLNGIKTARDKEVRLVYRKGFNPKSILPDLQELFSGNVKLQKVDKSKFSEFFGVNDTTTTRRYQANGGTRFLPALIISFTNDQGNFYSGYVEGAKNVKDFIDSFRGR